MSSLRLALKLSMEEASTGGAIPAFKDENNLKRKREEIADNQEKQIKIDKVAVAAAEKHDKQLIEREKEKERDRQQEKIDREKLEKREQDKIDRRKQRELAEKKDREDQEREERREKIKQDKRERDRQQKKLQRYNEKLRRKAEEELLLNHFSDEADSSVNSKPTKKQSNGPKPVTSQDNEDDDAANTGHNFTSVLAVLEDLKSGESDQGLPVGTVEVGNPNATIQSDVQEMDDEDISPDTSEVGSRTGDREPVASTEEVTAGAMEVVEDDDNNNNDVDTLVENNDNKQDDVDDEPEVKKKKKKGKQPRRILDELGVSMEIGVLGGDPPEFERHHSSRAAAVLAMTKMKQKVPLVNTVPMKESNSSSKGSSKLGKGNSHDDNEGDDDDEEEEDKNVEWVMCESCTKWRRLPRDINPDSLPDLWDCSMITWLGSSMTCEKTDIMEATNNRKSKQRGSIDDKVVTAGAGGAAGSKAQQPRKSISRAVSVELDDMEGDIDLSTSKKKNRSAAATGGGGSGGASTASSGTDVAASVESSVQPQHPQQQQQQTQPKPPPKPSQQQSSNKVVESINWVECDLCHKWRKVPASVDPDSLPEVWTCSLNFWSPAFARCSAKEEEEDKNTAASGGSSALHIAPVQPARRGRPHSNNNLNNNNNNQQQQGSAAKKVTQWVQCERASCKKWRKVPSYINPGTLSDNWYCELNTWDAGAASCDAQEDSDSEVEAQGAATNARTHLILANSKGPGQLSYRRIIFGPDGRIKQHYSEKNKIGYGIFSYTEVNKSSTMDGDEPMPPVKKIGYWSSDLYDPSGLQFTTTMKRRKMSQSSLSKRLEKELENEQLNSVDPEDKPDNNGSNGMQGTTTTHLLDTIRRISNWSAPTAAHPVLSKRLHEYQKLTTEKKLACARNIVRSCMLSFLECKEVSVPFELLLDKLSETIFLEPATELCRQFFSADILKETIRDLENAGECEVTENAIGERFIRLLPRLEDPCPFLREDIGNPQLTHLPLKLRKLKLFAPEALQDGGGGDALSPLARGNRGTGSKQANSNDLPI